MNAFYEINLREISTIIDCSDLNNAIDEVILLLRIMGKVNGKHLDIHWEEDVLHATYWFFHDTHTFQHYFKNIYSDEVIQEKLRDVFKLIRQLLKDFKNKTSVFLYWELDDRKSNPSFHLSSDCIIRVLSQITKNNEGGYHYVDTKLC